MRTLSSSLLLLLLPACATPARIVATSNDTAVELRDVVADLAKADVVVLGELHDSQPVHATHHLLIEELYERRPNMVIALEMFERDVQNVLLQYLAGTISEAEFKSKSRPWPNYETDYKPVIEFAKANGLVVIAANVPRPLAARVAKEGLGAIAGNRDAAREVWAPEDDYREAVLEAMKGHAGATPESLERMYVAQCVKDDTMAESIADWYAANARADDRPLVVLVCGAMHSNHRRGTVARLLRRLPKLDVRVLSAEAVDLAAGKFASSRAVGDYVVVAQAPREKRAMPVAPPAAAGSTAPVAATPAKVEPAKAADAKPAPKAEPAADENADMRPALGFQPDYAGGDGGVLVGSVRDGGPAATAGIEAGDVILELAGVKVKDVAHYAEVLDKQTIGKTIPVRVRREAAEVVLQVKVGSRPRSPSR